MQLLKYSSLNTSCTPVCIFINTTRGCCVHIFPRVRTVRLCVCTEKSRSKSQQLSCPSLSICSANVHASVLSTVLRRRLSPARIMAAVIHSGRLWLCESKVVGMHFAAF